MARDVTGPWLRASKNTWYATFGGAKVSLKIKGEENRDAAVKAWHRLMADGQTATPNRPQGADAPPALTVQELVDLFLTDISTRLKPLTVGQYRIASNSSSPASKAPRQTRSRRWRFPGGFTG